MKQYWINDGGIQQGPLTADELRSLSLSPNAYVWSAGMADWAKVSDVPELAHLVTSQALEAPQPVAEETIVSSAPQVSIPEIPNESTVIPEVPQPAPQQGFPAQPEYVAPSYPAQQNYSTRQDATPRNTADGQAKCPPTNLVWGIIATVLCCLPAGVVAIIYSTKVTSSYKAGDLEAAEHYSEVSAWWCIGSIIAGIVLQPVMTAVQMAMMGM